MNITECVIDAESLTFKELNELVYHAAMIDKVDYLKLINVNGQRYIGTGLKDVKLKIDVVGTPGQDLAAFMRGPTIEVFGNAQDGVGNTMDDGNVIIHGNIGDIAGYGMRGGEILAKVNGGYRIGIHMKEYQNKKPVIVIGGAVGDFCGEYMAGGTIIVLGMTCQDGSSAGEWIGTGMHGGKIFIRGTITRDQLGVGTKMSVAQEKDMKEIEFAFQKFSTHFGVPLKDILENEFSVVEPISHRPFARLYTLE
jgi:glutamate synthase domain-containing protein 3